jgi:hypothetical protein
MTVTFAKPGSEIVSLINWFTLWEFARGSMNGSQQIARVKGLINQSKGATREGSAADVVIVVARNENERQFRTV